METNKGFAVTGKGDNKVAYVAIRQEFEASDFVTIDAPDYFPMGSTFFNGNVIRMRGF